MADEPRTVPAWLDVAAAYSWRFLAVVLAAGVIVLLLARLHLIFIPVAVAIILTTVFAAPTRALTNRGLPRGLAAALAIIGGVALVAGLGAVVTGSIVSTTGQMGDVLQQARTAATDVLTNEPFGMSQRQVSDLISRGVQALRSNASVIAGGLLAGTFLLFEVIGGAVLALVLAFFFLRDGDDIVTWAVNLFPERRRDDAREIGARAWSVLARYVRGVAIVAAVDAIGIGLGLLIVGVPLAIPLTLLVFVGGFIPIVGATVAGGVAVLVALVTAGPVQAAITLAIVIVVQQVDAHVLQPVVMGHEVPLHPALVLLAVGAGGVLWGVAGAALAVPIAAVLSAVGHEARVRHT